MRRVLLVLALAMSREASAACKSYIHKPILLGETTELVAYYHVCDTAVEIPSGTTKGDWSFASDDKKLRVWDGAAWNEVGGGGGGVSQMIVPLVADGASVAWTNMPAAVTFFSGSHRYATKLNLTDYTDVRLIVNKQATAGAAASVVRLRYRTAFDTTVGNWLTAGTSEVQVAVNVANTVQVSAWIPLVAGAKADVFVTLDGSGGDGVLDPAFGSIVAQFR